MERPSRRGVVRRVQSGDSVEHVLCQRAVVEDELADEEVERLVFGHSRVRQIADRPAENRSFVQLRDVIVSLSGRAKELCDLTFVPAKYGICRKLPDSIRAEGRSGMKLPGGPTAGCQSWLFSLFAINVLLTVSSVYRCRWSQL